MRAHTPACAELLNDLYQGLDRDRIGSIVIRCYEFGQNSFPPYAVHLARCFHATIWLIARETIALNTVVYSPAIT
jgi:hypothetical protein